MIGLRRLAGALALVILVGCDKTPDEARVVEVTGSGNVSVQYDVVAVRRFYGEFRANEKEAAAAGAIRLQTAALAALKRAGLTDSDVISKFEPGRRPLRLPSRSYWSDGFWYSLRISPPEKATAVLRAGLAAIRNAGGIPLGGEVYLEVLDETEQIASGRKAALADARTRAVPLARQLGARLGKVVFVEELTVASPTKPHYPTVGAFASAEIDGLAPFIESEGEKQQTLIKLRVRYGIGRSASARFAVFGEGRPRIRFQVLRVALTGEFRGRSAQAAIDGAARVRAGLVGALKRAGLTDAEMVELKGPGLGIPFQFPDAGYWMTGASFELRIRGPERALPAVRAAKAAILAVGGVPHGSPFDLEVGDDSQTAAARASSVADATARARQLAALTDRRLGKTVSIREMSATGPKVTFPHSGPLIDEELAQLPGFIASQQDQKRSYFKLWVVFRAR